MKVLLTGGTGYLGEYLLAELLKRDHTVWALYRTDLSRLKTVRFLSGLGLPSSAGRLKWIRGDVLEIDEHWDRWCSDNPGLQHVDSVLQNAGSTQLQMDKHGEPMRTNVGGAKAIKRLIEHNPLNVHLISTAYVCGRAEGQHILEESHPAGDFVSVFEESKWEAEKLLLGAATILRPSIVVGDSKTGRSTRFQGWYVPLQGAYFLSNLLQNTEVGDRFNLGMTLPGDANGRTNIVPVDYVAKAAIRIIEKPEHHKQIFHLTHPEPPTNQWTLDLVQRRFDLGGMRFAGKGAPVARPRDQMDCSVGIQMQSVLFYFPNDPSFDRTNTDRAVGELEVPRITEALVNRLIDCAIGANWGQPLE